MGENKNQTDTKVSAYIAKLYRFLRWFTINAIFIWLMYEALYNKTSWAENVVMFAAHIVFILQMLGAIGATSDKIKTKPTKSVPQWLDHTYDIIVTLVFAGFGWFYYATLWFIQIFFVALIYQQKDV